ncbi:hypothetical protein [Helicobacter cinaedi]|nr:hypothetical protein [Helicobacter cinaedi]
MGFFSGWFAFGRGLWGLQKCLKTCILKKKGRMRGVFSVLLQSVSMFVSKCAKMQCEIALFFMML